MQGAKQEMEKRFRHHAEWPHMADAVIEAPCSPAALLAAATPAARLPQAPVRAALACGLPAASSAGQPLMRLGEGSRWRGGTRAGGGEAPGGDHGRGGFMFPLLLMMVDKR